MVNSLEGNNVERRMIGGRPAPAPRRTQAPKRDNDFVANIAEKRYLWTARAFAIITAISICCNIVLMLALIQVLPLYRIEPFLLTFQNKQEQVYNIVQVQGLEDQRHITEIFVREYVLLRSSFSRNIPEMEARWLPGGPIQEMSSDAVYNEFLERTAKRAVVEIRKRGISRNVKIISANELSPGLWQVEYEARDMLPDSVRPQVSYWTASMRIMYRNKTVKYGERLKNPVGFTVVKYSLTHNKVE